MYFFPSRSYHRFKGFSVYRGAHIRTGQKYEWLVHVFFVARPIFPQKFVARPIFRINIYGVYFAKIEKMPARPKNHQKTVARRTGPPYSGPFKNGKNVFWPVLICDLPGNKNRCFLLDEIRKFACFLLDEICEKFPYHFRQKSEDLFLLLPIFGGKKTPIIFLKTSYS